MDRPSGVVAVVRPSRHAGLTVTLLSPPHHQRHHHHHNNQPGRDFDEQYLGLEGMRDTRASKSNVETNTERFSNIGPNAIRYHSGYQCVDRLQSPPTQPVKESLGNGSGEMIQNHYRHGHAGQEGFMYHRRSSQLYYVSSVPMDLFIQSLRQYPQANNSAELVQKLLDHTQGKHHNRKHHSRREKKSLKTSTNRTALPTSQLINRTEKNLENVSGGADAGSGRSQPHPFVSIADQRSSEGEHLSPTYDYLRGTSRGQRTDARYLTEIQNALREKLKEIFEDKPEVCPKLQERYRLHRRLYHGDKQTEISKSLPHKVCTCPKACTCGPSTNKILKDWISSIPVYPDFSEEDRKKLNAVIEELISKLNSLEEPNFNIKAKKEIIKSLGMLPMWHPTDSNESYLLKEQLADNLVEKLSEINKSIKAVKDFESDEENRQLKSRTKGSIEIAPDENMSKSVMAKSSMIEGFKEASQSDIPKELLHKYENRQTTKPLRKSKGPIKESQNNSKRISGISELSHRSSLEKKDFKSFRKNKVNEYKTDDLPFNKNNRHGRNGRQPGFLKNEPNKASNTKYTPNLSMPNKYDSEDAEVIKLQRGFDKTVNSQNKSKFVENIKQELPSEDIIKDLIVTLNDIVTNDDELLEKLAKDAINSFIDSQVENANEIIGPKDRESLEKIILRGLKEKLQQNELISLYLPPKLSSFGETALSPSHASLHEQIQLASTKENTKQQKLESESNLIYDDVVRLLKDVPGFDTNFDHYEYNAINDLINTLNSIRTIDDGLAEIQAKQAINNFIETVSDNTGKAFFQKDRQLFERTLLKRIKQKSKRNKENNIDFSSTPKSSAVFPHSPDLSSIQNTYLQNRLRQESPKLRTGETTNESHILYDDVVELLKNIPGIDNDFDFNDYNKIEDLISALNHINTSDKVVAENLAKDVINDFIDTLSKDMGVSILPKDRKVLERKLLQQTPMQIGGVQKAPRFRKDLPGKSGILHDDVIKLLKRIPEIDKNIDFDDYSKIEDLISTLNHINTSDEVLAENLAKDVINDFIDTLSKDMGVSILPKDRKLLERQLLQETQLRTDGVQKARSIRKELSGKSNILLDDVVVLLKKIPGIDNDIDFDDYNKIEDFISTLNQINTSDEVLADNLAEDVINDFIDTFSKDMGLSILPKDRELLKVQLLQKLPIQTGSRLKKDSAGKSNIFYDDIVSLLRKIPGIDKDIDFDNYNRIKDLISTLNHIDNSDKVLAENVAKDIMNDFIENLSRDMGVSILPQDQKLLKKNLLQAALQTRQMKETSPPPSSAVSPDLPTIRKVSLPDGSTEPDEYLNRLNYVIDSWLDSLNIVIPNKNDVVSSIASDIVDRRKYLELSKSKTSEVDELDLLRYQIFKKLKKLNLENLPVILSRVRDLNERISSIDNNPFNASNLEKKINSLITSLKIWLDNINYDSSGSKNKPYEGILQDLANIIADIDYSINYFHLKNEILDWLPQIFTNLDKNTINNLADSLIDHLINNSAIEAKTDTGTSYRLMLWAATSETLPSVYLSNNDDINDFDLCKEKLIDAFINLHYFADNMEALEKYKSKLLDAVNKFCNEYLNRYPEAPMSPEDLSKKLYIALRNVSIPDIETIRPDLEQVRLKTEIMEWLQKVPIDKSKNTEPQLNALVSELAKRLHRIENDKNLGQNKHNLMKTEIIIWLQICGTRDDEKLNLLDASADILINKLKSSDKSRMLNASNIGKNSIHIISPSFLKSEDRAHLEKIRKRSNYWQEKRSTTVSTRAPLKECEIQTEINDKLEGTVQTSASLRRTCDRGVSPQVIIREYHWNSTKSTMSQTIDPRCSRGKVSETEYQMIRIPERFLNPNTQTGPALNTTYPQTTHGSFYKNNYSSEENNRCIRPQRRCFYEGRCRMCKLSFASEVAEPGRSGGYYCPDCAQRRYGKCRGSHLSFRQQSSRPEPCLRHCSNCSTACPYPSYLFFRKEF